MHVHGVDCEIDNIVTKSILGYVKWFIVLAYDTDRITHPIVKANPKMQFSPIANGCLLDLTLDDNWLWRRVDICAISCFPYLERKP